MSRDLDIDILGYDETKTKKKNRKKLLENLLNFAVKKGNSVSQLTEFEAYSDMSRRTVYNYYQNANELLIDLQIVVLNTYRDISEYEINQELDGYENLERCFNTIVEKTYENSDLLIYMDIFDNHFNDVYPDEKYMDYIRFINADETILERIIIMGIDDGTIKDFGSTSEISKSITRTIMDSVTRNIYRARSFDTDKNEKKSNVEALAQILLSGLKNEGSKNQVHC